MVPPNSGMEVAKKPSKTDKITMINKSQNQILFNLLVVRPNNK